MMREVFEKKSEVGEKGKRGDLGWSQRLSRSEWRRNRAKPKSLLRRAREGFHLGSVWGR